MFEYEPNARSQYVKEFRAVFLEGTCSVCVCVCIWYTNRLVYVPSHNINKIETINNALRCYCESDGKLCGKFVKIGKHFLHITLL